MISNVSTKAIAWAGISVLTAGLIAVGTVVTEGFLFRIKEAGALVEAARAEIEKSKAEMQKAIAEKLSADASKLDAENKLLAAIEARNGQMIAAQYMAGAQQRSADIAGRSLIQATEIDRHVDNTMFDGFAKPMILDPSGRISSLNQQIVRLRREGETGIDRKTRRALSEDERADRLAEAKILEEDIVTEQETSAKNMGDTIRLVMKGATQAFGSLVNGGAPTWTSRRIVASEQ